MMLSRSAILPAVSFCLCVLMIGGAEGQQPAGRQPTEKAASPQVEKSAPAAQAAAPKKSQAELEADLSKALSGATLEGSFNFTGRQTAGLSPDKYTLGEVKKSFGNVWTFQYKFREQVVPLPIPIVWAGDTPVISIDNFSFAGMGPYSARVMFYEDHYSGYWKHGDRGGLMFGVVHRAQPGEGAAANTPGGSGNGASTPASDAGKK